MSRYRSELDSLRRRERDLQQRLVELDRAQGVGRHAATRGGRLGYRLGSRLGSLIRRWFQKGEGENDLARLRELLPELEARIAEREQRLAETEAAERARHESLEAMYRAGRAIRNTWDNLRRK